MATDGSLSQMFENELNIVSPDVSIEIHFRPWKEQALLCSRTLISHSQCVIHKERNLKSTQTIQYIKPSNLQRNFCRFSIKRNFTLVTELSIICIIIIIYLDIVWSTRTFLYLPKKVITLDQIPIYVNSIIFLCNSETLSSTRQALRLLTLVKDTRNWP